MTRLHQASSRLREIVGESREAELDRLEREVKFSDDPAITGPARKRYLELTDQEHEA